MPLLKEKAGLVSASTIVLFLLLKQNVLPSSFCELDAIPGPVLSFLLVCITCIWVCVETCSLPTSHQSETEATWRYKVA